MEPAIESGGEEMGTGRAPCRVVSREVTQVARWRSNGLFVRLLFESLLDRDIIALQLYVT